MATLLKKYSQMGGLVSLQIRKVFIAAGSILSHNVDLGLGVKNYYDILLYNLEATISKLTTVT